MEMFSLRLREWTPVISCTSTYAMAHSGLFVQPRYARFLNKNAVLERMGVIPVTEMPRRAPEEAALSRVPLPAAQESS
jgi:hypothetical protein